MAKYGKPLPLKQRTSSLDQRRDYSMHTWTSVLGILKLREFLVTVDSFSIWRRHVAWATESGKDLRSYLTQRYASSMVFLSLLLSTELGVLFNSSGVTTDMRTALGKEEYQTTSFWCGILIIASAMLTILSLISTFTAWTMVSAVSAENAHCIFRSSIGQYAAELPGRFIVGAIYTFLIWICLFFFLLLPLGVWSTSLLILSLGLFVHTITAFSAFGRIIMHSGAMSSSPIFTKEFEQQLSPHSIHRMLVAKAKANLANNTSIRRQYMSQRKSLGRNFSEGELSGHLNGLSQSSMDPVTTTAQQPVLQRRRTNSIVKFADGIDTNGDRVNTIPPPPPPRTTPLSSEPFSSLSPLATDGGGTVGFPRTSSSNGELSPTRPLSPHSPSLRRPPRPRRQFIVEQQSDATAVTRSSFLSEDSILSATRLSPLGGDSVSMASATDPQGFAERWIQQQQQDQTLSDITILEQDYPLQRPSLWSNSDLTLGSSVELSEDEVNERFEQQFGDLFDPEQQQDHGASSDDPERQQLLPRPDAAILGNNGGGDNGSDYGTAHRNNVEENNVEDRRRSTDSKVDEFI